MTHPLFFRYFDLSNTQDTSHITETNVKFLTKEPIVGLKISDGDTLKKRLQITFDSAGHFNHFALKIRLWLGLSVVVSRSLEDQLLMSQDYVGLQTQQVHISREPVEPTPELKFQPTNSQASNVDKDSQTYSQLVYRDSKSELSLPQPPPPQASQASQQAPQSIKTDDTTHLKPTQSYSQTSNPAESQFAIPAWQMSTPQAPLVKAYPSIAASNFQNSINILVGAAQGLQTEMTGSLPQVQFQPPGFAGGPTVTGPFTNAFGDTSQTTQFSQPIEKSLPRFSNLNRSILNVLSQASQSTIDDTIFSQPTQRFDNSCFSIDSSLNGGIQSQDTTVCSGALKTKITEQDLRDALEDIPFDLPTDEPEKKKAKKGSKMDSFLNKALEEAMKDDEELDELDDLSLRFKIAQKLKSRSFKSFVRRVDKLIGGKSKE